MSARTVQPGMSFEYIMWIFTRISGLALILLAMIGMASAFALGARTQLDLPALTRWTFFPNPNHVINSNIPDVTLGWANGFWQIMQILIVFLGATHGFNGLRVVVEDFTGPTLWRPFMRGLVFLLWIFFLIVAMYVILAS
jgi:succinate dehydrogenase / fumarate reductase, membrane anchor subunit